MNDAASFLSEVRSLQSGAGTFRMRVRVIGKDVLLKGFLKERERATRCGVVRIGDTTQSKGTVNGVVLADYGAANSSEKCFLGGHWVLRSLPGTGRSYCFWTLSAGRAIRKGTSSARRFCCLGSFGIVRLMNETPTSERIRSAQERNARAVALRPALGQKTVHTTVRMIDGLCCEIEEGRWKIISDASEKSGGTGKGPDPGAMCRAALGACLALGYTMWAARLQVPVENLEIELESDFDARGQYGIGDVRPGHAEIRYNVRIESSASDEDIQAVVDKADAASMVLDAFANTQKLVRRLEIVRAS